MALIPSVIHLAIGIMVFFYIRYWKKQVLGLEWLDARSQWDVYPIILPIFFSKCKIYLSLCKAYFTFGKRSYMLYKALLPHQFKRIGWCILIPATIFGIILIVNGFDKWPFVLKVFAIYGEEIFGKSHSFTFMRADITNTLAGALFIIGGLLVGFSKEKNEDEFISNLRLSSLLWAVVTNYIVLLFCLVFVYGPPFLNVMLYNMFTILIIFIVRFNYVLYRNLKAIADEKHD